MVGKMNHKREGCRIIKVIGGTRIQYPVIDMDDIKNNVRDSVTLVPMDIRGRNTYGDD